MQRSASFSHERPSPRQAPPTRIPTPSTSRLNVNGTPSSNVTPERPTSLLRRSASLRLPSTSGSRMLGEREVWGVGSGSWGKRQQMRRQQGLESRSAVSSPVSPRGPASLGLFDRLTIRGNSALDDDDDACSERSYDSTMSMDRITSRSKRYVVHCGQHDSTPTTNGASYLTPTQRTAQMNRELKAQLRQALEDIACREREISRLTQECVELRMNNVRSRESASPDRSRTPSYVEKDSLNSSVHSNSEQVPLDSNSVLKNKDEVDKSTDERVIVQVQPEKSRDVEQRETMEISKQSISVKPVIVDKSCVPDHTTKIAVPKCLPQPLSLDSGTCEDLLTTDLGYTSPGQQNGHTLLGSNLQDAATQTVGPTLENTSLEDQLNAAKEALIETKGAQQERQRTHSLLSVGEAVLLWQQASFKVQLSRARAAAGSSHADVTLQFLKSAFFHLITGSGQATPGATKSHWKAIQSILGFSPEECKAMDNSLATGMFPGADPDSDSRKEGVQSHIGFHIFWEALLYSYLDVCLHWFAAFE